MDHDEVLEQLELAAVEPGGIDRLMAGDTAAAAAVAGHLAGCESCAGELERLRRATPLLRDVVRTTPPTDLRDRTLAFVRAQGVPRGRGAAAGRAAPEGGTAENQGSAEQVSVFPAAQTPAPPAPAAPTTNVPLARATGTSRLGGFGPWIASIAAAVVLSVALTSAIVGQRIEGQVAAQSRTIEHLGEITRATLAVMGEPDMERVHLEATEGAAGDGQLIFSPSTTKLVVVATGLVEPPPGQEYRCWVESAGERTSIGKLFFGGDLAYWVGDVGSIGSLPEDSTFGVSVTEAGGASMDAAPVMVGAS